MSLSEQLVASRVLPVITANDVDATVRLAQALEKGGMKAVEVTLRTPAALESIRAIKAALPQMQVAAGTVINPSTLEQSQQAGADFCVSPGITESLLRAAIEQARAGDVIILASGRYDITANLVAQSVGTSAAPIVVRADVAGSAKIHFDALEGFMVSGAHWQFEALDIKGVKLCVPRNPYNPLPLFVITGINEAGNAGTVVDSVLFMEVFVAAIFEFVMLAVNAKVNGGHTLLFITAAGNAPGIRCTDTVQVPEAILPVA